jgi:peptidoglycan/xylan/chitin deacetylase (PgdA/CDA1 family)
MLNFKTASLLFVIALIGVISLHYSIGLSWWWLLPVVLAYKIRLILGSSRIDSNFHTQVYCEGKAVDKEIALTFDDGPSPFTKGILTTLAAYQAPATFFVIGKNIQGHEAILKQTLAAGHTIGNHTFSHSFFIDFKNAKGFKQELNQTADTVFDVIGKRMKFFRPPYGVTTPHLAKAARELDYRVIGWNIRSLDTTSDSEELIFKRIIQQLKPGAIILFHDTSEKTNNVLKQVLQYATENQFKIVGLEKLVDLRAYQHTTLYE